MPDAQPSLKILIVDDNKDSVFTLSFLLTKMGHEVATAYDGLTAIRLVSEYHPELMLLDIAMPGMGGDEVCRQVRQTSEGDTMMIVAQTGWGKNEIIHRTKEAGFDRYIGKPVDPDLLEEILQQACERKLLSQNL